MRMHIPILFLALTLGGGWAAAQDFTPAQNAVPGESNLNVFNPTLTLVGNTLWRVDNKDVIHEHDGETHVLDDRFSLRELELDLRAAVDPYADAVAIISAHSHDPGVYELEVEEGYINIKSLPFFFWEEPPLGTVLKVGRFLTSVGIENRLHTHDLPQSMRGLTFENFIGAHPYGAEGVSAHLFLPWFIEEGAWTLTAEAVQGGGWKMGHDGTNQPAYIGNLDWFHTIADEHDLEIALIETYGSNDADGRRQAKLSSLDLFYRWRPIEGGAFTSLVLAGQLFYGSREFQDEATLVSGTNRAFGGFVYTQYQIDRRWYAGVRYDRTEHLENRDILSQRLNPYVSYYLSEFFRIRAGYEQTWSDDPALDGLKTFLLEVNFVFGAHPPHPYWANF